MNLQPLFVFLVIILSSLRLSSQNFVSAAFPNANNEIYLSLFNFCGDAIQWQIREVDSEEWMNIPEGTNNDFAIDVGSLDFSNKIFRAKTILLPNSEPQFSYPFSIRIIYDLNELKVNDFYDGAFVYSVENGHTLGGFFTLEESQWGCFEVDIDGADNEAVGGGVQNTIDILNACSEELGAASICNGLILNGNDDWYLPSKGELELLLLTLQENEIQQIQRQFGLSAGPINNSKRYWASTEADNHPDSFAKYGQIYGGVLFMTTAFKKDQFLNILVSRDLKNSAKISNQCQTFYEPYQFRNYISVNPHPEDQSQVLVEYIGNGSEKDNYSWEMDGGEIIEGFGMGPITVKYPNTLYHRIGLEFDNLECSSPYFESDLFQVKFFEEIPSNIPESYNGNIEWLDFNNDNNLDVILIGSKSSIIMLSDNEGNLFAINDSLPILNAAYLSLGDYDNDGLVDVLISGMTIIENRPKTFLYKNINGESFEFIDTDLEEIGQGFSEWFDFNNDGKLDIILSGLDENNDPTTIVYKGDGSGLFTVLTSPFPNLYNCAIALDDFNRDGYRDIFICGNNGSERVAQIYRNDKGAFTKVFDNLPGIDEGEASWADFDNDGFLDLVYSGNIKDILVEFDNNQISVDAGSSASLFFVYGNGMDVFEMDSSEVKDFGFPNKYALSSLDLGDYNQDGREDLVISGIPTINWVSIGIGGSGSLVFDRKSTPSIIENLGGKIFKTQNVNIPHFFTASNMGSKPDPTPPLEFECSAIRFGDFDRDGDLDILREGRKDGFQSGMYRNLNIIQNFAPSIPDNLNSIVDCSTVKLEWGKSFDDHTISSGITYEIYVGTSPGANDVFSRKNIKRLRSNSFLIENLPDGTYYWGAKAVDNAHSASTYSSEQLFEIDCIAGIESTPDYANISIHPNPFENLIFIQPDDLNHEFKVQLINTTGNTLLDRRFEGSGILDTSPLPTGIYLVKLNIRDQVVIKKMIKF